MLGPRNINPVAMYFGNGTVRAFGFTLSTPADVTPAMPADFTVTVYEGGVAAPVLSESYSSAPPNYLGFVETAGSPGISEVLITPVQDTGNTTYNFGLDDVSHGPITPGGFPVVIPFAVPGPSSLAMLAAGLAGVSLLVRRREG